MKKGFRIKKNEDFQAVFKKGNSVANRQFVVYILKKEEQGNFRIGLSVSKKVGNAVVRNQIKRYIRQSFLELDPQIKSGNDYVIIARKPVAEMDFHQIKKSLQHVLRLGKVLTKLEK
ncbi:ribonuclease P protein component [Lederbergia galactosidilytica]|uniref:Ribonuclease P protein component n=1 Tax=Lederbergia galactosidilytica TaxID=217031 RepID=A0A178A5F4_9BACI|nr:ribonuclease P protein component [Lederbergia galactosidilytica]KRG07995.1 ribonuclease P [Virgibacillus soli]MBP1915226.1 ribonuclease P protein component [Lederbergia galactosidilytica]OAK75436.1 ribonuclease P [Lederbergia galactosidilytica]